MTMIVVYNLFVITTAYSAANNDHLKFFFIDTGKNKVKIYIKYSYMCFFSSIDL